MITQLRRRLDAKLKAQIAIDKLAPAVSDWVHSPHEGKQAIADAYASLTQQQKDALDEHTREVFDREHGGQETVMYRYKDSGRTGLTSMSPVEPKYLSRDKYTAYRVKASDVLVHYGHDESPLATRAFGHEKEVILKPDAAPEVWDESKHPRDEQGRFT